jgi:putative hydrolase of the HAD superfamily
LGSAQLSKLDIIALDADDTLWHCESLFQSTQVRLIEILDQYADHQKVTALLHDTEERNIGLFGFGIKGFTLSMIETAIEISEQKISATDIHEITMMGKAMLDSPLDLFDGVEEVLSDLAKDYPLYLITKGDNMDQYNKIEKSGLARHFTEIDVVLKKDVATYRDLFAGYGIDPSKALMAGNSVPSDVLPILELGGWGVHIPYHVIASFEQHDDDPAHSRFRRLEGLNQLPGLLAGLKDD